MVFHSSSDFLQGLPPGQYPFLAEHVVGHIESEFGDRSGFELELDLILDRL